MSLNNKKDKSQDSLFLEFPDFLRYLFLAYVVIQYIISPFYKVFINDVVYSNTYARLSVSVLYAVLLYFPFLLYNKKKFGLLNPFIFSTLLLFSKSILKHYSDFLPRMLSSSPLFSKIVNEGLSGFDQDVLTDYDLQVKICFVVYIFFQYLGYFLTNPKPYLRLYDKNTDSVVNKNRLVYLTLFVFAFALMFFEMRGGLTEHFTSFGKGRQRSLHGMGIIFVFFSVSNLALMVWAAIDKSVFKSIWFWGLMIFSIIINYLGYGARSIIFESIINIMLVWIIHYRKIPYVAIVIVGCIGFFVLTVLGALRATTYSGEVDWSVITEYDAEKTSEQFEEELKKRDGLNAPDIVIMGRGVEEFGLFYGKTYLSAILFFVPRFIWDDKPHTISFYTGTMLFNSVGGMPPSIVMEAYWNFYYFGIVFIGFLHGVMFKWAVNFYKENNQQKISIVLFIIAITKLEPSSLTLTHFVQRFFAVLIIYYVANIASFKNQKVINES